ncbi:TonB-dependent receptor family protein [Flavobacterium sp.]|uniref:TonB-dependent receptor family protein n=1 Tax=Flavobacterium sp. TaxID=239 RepID=UPI0037C12FB6
MNLKPSIYSFVLFCLLVMFSALSSAQTIADTTALSEVILKGTPIPNTIQNSAASIATITSKEINQNDGVILTSVLNKIPGVSMQQGNLNTNRISMRGIGARSQFGTNRIKAYYENIPLSNGEGDTVLEDIDLESLNGIEIIKGPNTTSFGAGLGGVIHLMGKSTEENSSFGKIASTFGSFGLLKNTVSGGFNNGTTDLYLGYNQLNSDGFRENSDYDRKSMNLSAKQKLSENSSLSFFGIATRLKAFIPSSINQNDFENNPQAAAPNWKAAQGYESYDKMILGIGYQNKFSEKWSVESSVFSTIIDAYEPRPFDILDDETMNFGLRLQVNYNEKVFSIPSKFCLGTEVLFEDYTYSLYENLYQSQPGEGSIQGPLFATNNQKRNYQNVFFQMDMQLLKKMHLESGIAVNSTRYEQSDTFETVEPTKNSYSFGAIWSPRIGLSYQVGSKKNIYTSVSKGFSIPSIAESLTPDGLINTELQPEIGINYELGFKGSFLKQKIYTEIALYSTNVSNLLVARRVGEDQFIGINAGESLHQGIEFLFQMKVIEKTDFQVNSFFSGTYTNIRFKDFVELENDYSGNQLPAVPKEQWNIGLDFTSKLGWNANISFGKVGQMALNDANTIYTDSYELVDAKVSYTFNLFIKLNFQCNAGVQNILNQNFAASILPNAVGFGTAPPRYFYPGNPINYYGGIGLVYEVK